MMPSTFTPHAAPCQPASPPPSLLNEKAVAEYINGQIDAVKRDVISYFESKQTEWERNKLITSEEAGRLVNRCAATIREHRKNNNLKAYQEPGGGGRFLYKTGEVLDLFTVEVPTRTGRRITNRTSTKKAA
jgi:hypothetical protein